jgi:hypothetical protein
MTQPTRTAHRLVAVAALAAFLGSLTGCGSGGDTKALQQRACDDWTTIVAAKEDYLQVLSYLGDTDPTHEQILKDGMASWTKQRDETKSAFAAAAKKDSAWVPVQEALLHYINDLGIDPSVDTSSDESTVDAACARLG